MSTPKMRSYRNYTAFELWLAIFASRVFAFDYTQIGGIEKKKINSYLKIQNSVVCRTFYSSDYFLGTMIVINIFQSSRNPASRALSKSIRTLLELILTAHTMILYTYRRLLSACVQKKQSEQIFF